MGESPDAHDAQGGGEAVGEGHVRVGERHEEPVDRRPNSSYNQYPITNKPFGEVADGQALLFGRAAHPLPVAIDSHREVVELHAAVGIEALLVVEHDAEGLHCKAHDPHPDAGPILQQDIRQSQDRRHDIQPMLCQECTIHNAQCTIQNLSVTLPIMVNPAIGMKPI